MTSPAALAPALDLPQAGADARQPPALFDGCYELFELLGVGAKAEVHRAYHRDLRRYVALKFLRKEVLEDPEERRRLDREARVLASLVHPAIPALIDCRTSTRQDRPYIAMELRRGERVADLGTLPLGEVVVLGQQLAGALAVMHARGIIHRDLNRTNVLIERFGDGRAPRASIIDFGQAELTDAFHAQVNERYPTRPELRVVLGSGNLERADWTAPESRAGRGWSTASDVFSLGLLLHLLLTGKRPAEESPGVWRSPDERVPECRGPLAEAILGALQVDPRLRLDARNLGEYLGYAETGDFKVAPEPAPKLDPVPAPAVSRTALSSAPDREPAPAASPAVVSSAPDLDPEDSQPAPEPVLSGSPAAIASAPAPARRSIAWFGTRLVVVALAAWAIGRGGRHTDGADPTSFARLVRSAAAEQGRPTHPAEEEDDPVEAKGAEAKEVDPAEAKDVGVGTIEPEPSPRSQNTRGQPLPSIRTEIRRVENELRACSRLADGLLLVEFSTDGSERFAAVIPIAETDPALLECVRQATAEIRFTPTRRPKFIEEYRP